MTEPTLPSAEVSAALVASITANVDAMERATLRAVVLATVAVWLGLAEGRAANLVVLSVRVPVDRSALTLAAVLSASMLEVAFRLRRVTATQESLDAAAVPRGLLALWAHPWLFNPLSWGGRGSEARGTGVLGAGLALGLLALCMAAVFSLGLLGEREGAAAAATGMATSGVVFALAARRAAQVGERLTRAIEDDPAGLAEAAAVVARRSLAVLVLTGAGLVSTLSLAAWWVRSG